MASTVGHLPYTRDYRDVFEKRWDGPPRKAPRARRTGRTLLGREEQNFAAGYAAYLQGHAEAAGQAVDGRAAIGPVTELSASTKVHAGAFRPGAVRITGHDIDEVFRSLNAAGRALLSWTCPHAGREAWTRRLERAGYRVERV